MSSLSIIIPTRNRATYLACALESFTKQSYPANLFEVIIIDNGSTDNTREVSASYSNRINNLLYYYEPSPGLHVGRHMGMKMSRSDILVYADDDIESFPTWLEAIAKSFQDPEVALVGGKNLPKFESEPPDWIWKMWKKDRLGNSILGYLSILDLGDVEKEINPYHVFGCNFSVRKNILLEAGGFHPDAMPQELIRYRGDGESHISKYILEKGYKALYHPKASVYHLVPSNRMTEEYFCRRAFNQGISDSYTHIRENIKEHSFVRKNKENYVKRIGRFLRAHIQISKIREYRFYLAYKAGYEYHTDNVIHDKQLYDWVTKDSYI